MQVFLMTFFILAVVVIAMSLGVIFSNREIKGSCGGLNKIKGLEGSCKCEKPCENRLKREAEAAEADRQA